ncbi:cytochrome P450 [Alkalicaulis satelles]|uniref:cytochrome P450 n=1 Tax=Alkalicaulis satelles TaxID=2609175 RepID=UPI0018EC7DC3|nr:cytochrome P450 [Alkalicaulis satelles]
MASATSALSRAVRPPDALFEPAASRGLDAPVSLIETARLMRANPMAILPEALFDTPRLTGPYLGRKVHEIAGPEHMQSVLQDNVQAWRKSPLILRMLTPILGDSILTAHGESWKRQRRILQPAFARRRIEPFASLMARAGLNAVERLLASDGPAEVHGVMNDATFQVIEQALFGEADGFDRGEVRAAIEVLLEEIGRMRLSDLVPWPEWTPRYMTWRARKARGIFRAAADSQIARRRAQDEPGEDFLGLLLNARDADTGAALSDRDIRDTLMTFIAAGHETTAIALTWALYLVANDPVCQDALRAEADAVYGAGEPDAEQSARLVYARQVIEEAMRLYPPAPILARRAVADTDICGHPVRKGDVALLAFYCLHRHRTLWAHPDRFDPDRFSPERRPRHPYQFMPFGGGPRACIGTRFAMQEAVIVLSLIASRTRITPAHGEVEPVMQVTLRPKGGMPLRFEAR